MMIINTTFHVENSLDRLFRDWIKSSYIPSALSSGLLSSPSFAQILTEVQDGCSSYAVSFKAGSINDATTWHDGEGADLRRSLLSSFGERVVFFSTYMDELPL